MYNGSVDGPYYMIGILSWAPIIYYMGFLQAPIVRSLLAFHRAEIMPRARFRRVPSSICMIPVCALGSLGTPVGGPGSLGVLGMHPEVHGVL